MRLFAGVFLGWSLGANNAANVFGTAVSSQMVQWKTAVMLIAVAVMAGAILQGAPGLETYRHIVANQGEVASGEVDAGGEGAKRAANSAFSCALAAAVTAAVMTFLSIPVSTSQAIVGGMIGIGLYLGRANFDGLGKVFACWIGTPIGAAIISAILYPTLARIIRSLKLHFLVYDQLMRVLLIIAGVWGAYALGANNVANATGVFYAAGFFNNGLLSPTFLALLLGGASIALGSLTYSKNVMFTVGKGITKLDAFSAFIVVASQAATVHVYAMVGVPVSTSQAVVGAVLGIGLLKGMRTVRLRTLGKIALGWLMTPIVGGLVATGIFVLISMF